MEPAGPERRPIMRQLFRKKCKEFDNQCWIFHGTLLNHTGPTCLLNRWPTPQSLRCWHTLGFFYIWQRKTHAALTFITSDHATELYVLVTTGAFYPELKKSLDLARKPRASQPRKRCHATCCQRRRWETLRVESAQRTAGGDNQQLVIRCSSHITDCWHWLNQHAMIPYNRPQ